MRYVFKRSTNFRERTTLSFSEERIHYRTHSVDSALDWSLFTGLIERRAVPFALQGPAGLRHHFETVVASEGAQAAFPRARAQESLGMTRRLVVA